MPPDFIDRKDIRNLLIGFFGAFTVTIGILVLSFLPGSFLNRKFSFQRLKAAPPISITSCSELQDMNLDLTADYSLDSDVDCTGVNFIPVGDFNTYFTGNFDGNNHLITNLVIDQGEANNPNSNPVGLFGAVRGSTISDVTLDSGSITGTDYTGALVGYASGATISNVISHIDVTGLWDDLGGLVGYLEDTNISDSGVTGTVTDASGTASFVGGLVGKSVYCATNACIFPDISNSYATGDVIIQSDPTDRFSGGTEIGGLVGFLQNGSIYRTYATGNVQGSISIIVGGMVGECDLCTIYESYATGNVTGWTDVGGFIGWITDAYISNTYARGNVTIKHPDPPGYTPGDDGADIGAFAGNAVNGFAGPDIINSYATGVIDPEDASTTNIGGFAGVGSSGIVGSNDIISVLWDTQTTGTTTSAIGTGKTTAEMKDVDTYTQNQVISYTDPTTTWSTLAAGSGHTLGIKTDGTLWATGINTSGQLGQGDTTSRALFTQVGSDTWSKVAAGSAHSVGIKTDGTLWTWGYNNYGALGLGNSGGGTNRTSPTQVGSSTWSTIAASERNTLGIKTDGTLWAWGENLSGQLGNGTSGAGTNTSTPAQIGTDSDWATTTMGRFNAYAIKTDGTLWAWGDNRYGQLGINDSGFGNIRTSPVQVGSSTNWTAVAATSDGAFGLKSDHTLWFMGRNFEGLAGLDDPDFSDTNLYVVPTQIGGAEWEYIAAGGSDYALAIKTDGSLWSWGYDQHGALGLGINTVSNEFGYFYYRLSPTQVGSSTDWSFVNIGKPGITFSSGHITLALKTDGTLWVAGDTSSAGNTSNGNDFGTNDVADRHRFINSPIRNYNVVSGSAGIETAWDFVGNSNDDVANADIWDIDCAGVFNDGYPFLTWQGFVSGSCSTPTPTATPTPTLTPTPTPTPTDAVVSGNSGPGGGGGGVPISGEVSGSGNAADVTPTPKPTPATTVIAYASTTPTYTPRPLSPPIVGAGKVSTGFDSWLMAIFIALLTSFFYLMFVHTPYGQRLEFIAGVIKWHKNKDRLNFTQDGKHKILDVDLKDKENKPHLE